MVEAEEPAPRVVAVASQVLRVAARVVPVVTLVAAAVERLLEPRIASTRLTLATTSCDKLALRVYLVVAERRALAAADLRDLPVAFPVVAASLEHPVAVPPVLVERLPVAARLRRELAIESPLRGGSTIDGQVSTRSSWISKGGSFRLKPLVFEMPT